MLSELDGVQPKHFLSSTTHRHAWHPGQRVAGPVTCSSGRGGVGFRFSTGASTGAGLGTTIGGGGDQLECQGSYKCLA